MVLTRVRAALAKPFMPVLFFFGGVTFDSVTLTRVDRLLDNLVLFAYLICLGGLIVFTGRAARAARAAESPGRVGEGAKPVVGSVWPAPLVSRAQPYVPHAIQFIFGSLFSAYTIFYLQSASLTSTAVFFGLLVALLVGNEFLHHGRVNLRLLLGLYALVCVSFLTYFLPVLTGLMHPVVFLLGAVLSAGLVLKVALLIHQGTGQGDAARREALLAGLPGVGVVGVLVVFYFLNWIPPVPLSLQFGGIYHQVTRQDGDYRLSFERGAWYQFWKRADDSFHGEGPAYCFTAVFAPGRLQTTVYHHWQHRPAGGRDFATTDRIAMPVSGGREGGYRGSTVKQRVAPGDWRVDLETARGQIIGRVSFRVEEAGEESPAEFVTIVR
ncbi:MAG: DUF2914 domain-containing protein [Nitrospirota bacterium]